MNPDLLRNYLARHHVDRRDVLRLMGVAGLAGAGGAALPHDRPAAA
ncbi:MAG: twin-arginine translocation signal domain-containing protein, partial [Saccharothrix sp.]|nr:twin-arginine translocation signal domain-containing protein [Saccharothrix sp.]